MALIIRYANGTVAASTDPTVKTAMTAGQYKITTEGGNTIATLTTPGLVPPVVRGVTPTIPSFPKATPTVFTPLATVNQPVAKPVSSASVTHAPLTSTFTTSSIKPPATGGVSPVVPGTIKPPTLPGGGLLVGATNNPAPPFGTQSPSALSPLPVSNYATTTYEQPTFTQTQQPGFTPIGSTPLTTFDQTKANFPAISPVSSGGDPLVAAWQADMNLAAARRVNQGADEAVQALLPSARAAEANVLSAVEARTKAAQATVGPQADFIAANRATLAERGKYEMVETFGLELKQQINADRLNAELAIQAAEADTDNILSVEHAQRTRDSLLYRFNIAGLPYPIEVDLPPDFEGDLPPGIIATLRTTADILKDNEAKADRLRAFELAAADIRTQLAGQRVDAAQIREGLVALKLDEANLALYVAGLAVTSASVKQDRVALLIKQAEDYARSTGIAVNRAILGVQEAGLAPLGSDGRPAVWYQPRDGSPGKWVTQAQHDTLSLQEGGPLGGYSLEGLSSLATLGDTVLNESAFRAELASRKFLPRTIDTAWAAVMARRALNATQKLTRTTGPIDVNAGVGSGAGAAPPARPGITPSTYSPFLFDPGPRYNASPLQDNQFFNR